MVIPHYNYIVYYNICYDVSNEFFIGKNVNERPLEKAKNKNVQDSKTKNHFEYETNSLAVEEKAEFSVKPKEVLH